MTARTNGGASAPSDKRFRLPADARAKMVELYATDMPTRDIAERFNVSEDYVRRVACRTGVRKGKPVPAQEATETPLPPKPRGCHLFAYRRAHRGFYVPPALEPAYTQLLVNGLSRRAAAVRLGVKS